MLALKNNKCYTVFMRVDKFLKVSRLLKRRTVANAACVGGRVKVNGKSVKPGHVLKVGDDLVVTFGNSEVRCIVKSVDEKAARGNNAEAMFEIITEGSAT